MASGRGNEFACMDKRCPGVSREKEAQSAAMKLDAVSDGRWRGWGGVQVTHKKSPIS